jgi:hypothetical protein
MPIEGGKQTGVALGDLARRVTRTNRPLSARALRDWLTGNGFAVNVNGRLQPTPLGFEVGDAIDSELTSFVTGRAPS